VWDASNLSEPVKTFTTAYPLEAASYCPAKVCALGCVVAGTGSGGRARDNSILAEPIPLSGFSGGSAGDMH
jgi:hypothetical protein